jgi:hypothetical protein
MALFKINDIICFKPSDYMNDLSVDGMCIGKIHGVFLRAEVPGGTGYHVRVKSIIFLLFESELISSGSTLSDLDEMQFDLMVS